MNMNFIKKIIHENNLKASKELKLKGNLNIFFSSNFILNNNLPNFENFNGLYAPKGTTTQKSFHFFLKNKSFTFSIEPQNSIINNFYKSQKSQKEGVFSVLNDVKNNHYNNNSKISFKNTGIRFKHNSIGIGLGNWNTWWGAGIHNSLSLSNNSLGFKHIYISYNKELKFFKNSILKYKYLISENFKNYYGNDFSLVFSMLNVKINKIEIGANLNYLIGGYEGYSNDNWFLFPSNLNNKLLPSGRLSHYFISYYNSLTGLRLFYEFGFPNRFNFNSSQKYRNENSLGTNIGIRKKELFNNPNIVFGLEYTRLVQGIYYNLEPTPNWYQNVKYNYYSYKGRRWGAHSGTDSDDFYAYSGIVKENFSFLFIFNYERHGVNYSFPPEVKFESGISTTVKLKDLFLHIKYENEYYEHYNFVDNNNSIWTNTFNLESIQRTYSLLLSLDYRIL